MIFLDSFINIFHWTDNYFHKRVLALYGIVDMYGQMQFKMNKWATSWKNMFECHIGTTKAQISLRTSAVWSAPLLFAA